MSELTKINKQELKELAKELNATAVQYKEKGTKALADKVSALSYEYIQSITKVILLKNSPTHQVKEETAEDVASELYTNRIANPELQVLEKFDVNAGCKFTTYISRKVEPNIYNELSKLAPIKISDEQNRQLAHLSKFFSLNGIDTTDKNLCETHKEEAKEYVRERSKTKKIDDNTFNGIWQYYFNKDSNISISSGEVEKEDTAVMIEDRGSQTNYENIDILNSVKAMLECAEKEKILTKLESEAFKLEICDIYGIDEEDKYDIRARYNMQFSLEETGYKLLVTGLLYEYFPDLAKMLVKNHPNKLRQYEKRYEYLLDD